METEQITIQVEAEAARAFKSASSQARRNMEALLSIRLSETTGKSDLAKTITSETSQEAEERGLTADALRSIVDKK